MQMKMPRFVDAHRGAGAEPWVQGGQRPTAHVAVAAATRRAPSEAARSPFAPQSAHDRFSGFFISSRSVALNLASWSADTRLLMATAGAREAEWA